MRLVEIDGIDVCACGGTHLSSTAEIEAVKLLGVEAMRGGCRLYWVAGGRVRARLGGHEARARQLGAQFDVADEDLVDAVVGCLERLKTAEKRVHRLERGCPDRLRVGSVAPIRRSWRRSSTIRMPGSCSSLRAIFPPMPARAPLFSPPPMAASISSCLPPVPIA